jgi:hypothetical protein
LETRTFLRLVLLAGVFLFSLFADKLLGPENHFGVSGQSYDSKLGPATIIQTPIGPVRVFELDFDALATDASYDNLLQTADRSGTRVGMRLEIQPPHNLVLIAGDDGIAPIDLSFGLGVWHHIRVSGERGRSFDVAVDGKTTHFDLAHTSIAPAEMRLEPFQLHLETVTLGSGYLPPRGLQGAIKNFALSADYARTEAWVPAAAIALAIVTVLLLLAPELRTSLSSLSWTADSVVLSVVFDLAIAGIVLWSLGAGAGKWNVLVAVGLSFPIVLGATALKRTEKPGTDYVVPLLVAGLLAAGTIAALSTIPNWTAFSVPFFEGLRTTFAAGTTVAACLAIILCSKLVSQDESPQPRDRTYALLSLLPYVLFALLALRTNSLFASPWSALYLLQAAALFVAGSLYYRTLHDVLKVGRALSSAIVAASFFFTNPDAGLLWCYVLLYIAAREFLGPAPSMKRFAKYGAIALVPAVLWSAESAVYSLAIFAAPICLYLFSILLATPKKPSSVKDALSVLWWPLGGLLAAAILFAVAHLLGHDYLPDVSRFVGELRAHGKELGELPLPVLGPLWVFFILMALGLVGLRKTLSATFSAEGPAGALAAATACVWILASYYFERATPGSVTALIPLLCMALAIILRSSGTDGRLRATSLAVAVPLFALAILSPFWNAALLPR